MKSFFFIPANRKDFIVKLPSIRADFIVFDFEDSIIQEEFYSATENFADLKISENHFCRLRFFDLEGNLNTKQIDLLLNCGFKNFLIPKFRNLAQIKIIEDKFFEFTDCRFILLIENPAALNGLNEIVGKTKLNLIGLSFGSQDYCSESNIEHSLENLKIPRFMISNTAKAYNLIAVDIANMILNDENQFRLELSEAKSLGYDGKFIIHPKQLSIFNSYKFFSKEEYRNAKNILDEFESLGTPPVFIHNGAVVEKPHINRYKKIINWYKEYERK